MFFMVFWMSRNLVLSWKLILFPVWFQVAENFDDMELSEELLRGIYAYGFEKPSAIQQRAIIPCVRGNDVIAQAQSGMNFLIKKTADYFYSFYKS